MIVGTCPSERWRFFDPIVAYCLGKISHPLADINPSRPLPTSVWHIFGLQCSTESVGTHVFDPGSQSPVTTRFQPHACLRTPNPSQRHGILIDEFISVSASTQKASQQRGVTELLRRLESGDVLLTSELSRLGRSVGQIIQIVDQLIKQEIRFVAVKEGIDLSGAPSLQTKVMVTLFSLFAEIERDLISQRTKEGLAAAQAKGKQIGRPKGSLGQSKLSGKESEIRLLLSKEVSKASIAKIFDVSRTALRHFIKTRQLV